MMCDDAVHRFILDHLREHGATTLHGLWMRAVDVDIAGVDVHEVMHVLDELRRDELVDRHVPARLGAPLKWTLREAHE